MTDYSKLNYWEERYDNNSEPFDWYQIYDTLKEKISAFIKPTDKILILGAGSSNGFVNITNIDYCSNIVKIMQTRYQEMGYNIKYIEGDVTAMHMIKSGDFNVIIDKGTLDSVLCGENSIPIVDKMMQDVYRILDTNGVFISISYADEDNRKTFFTTQDWEFSYDTITKLSKVISADVDSGNKDPKNYHFIYKMLKS